MVHKISELNARRIILMQLPL